MSTRHRRACFAALLSVLLPTLALASGVAPAAADGPTAVTFDGHGNGHGRGMGQWGAKGYAAAGQSAGQILDRFYGGTTAGTRAEPDLTVVLCDAEGVVICSSSAGLSQATITSAQPFSFEGIQGTPFGANTAVRITRDGPGQRWLVTRAEGGCGAGTFTNVGEGFISDPNGTTNAVDFQPGAAPLKLCEAHQRTYLGTLEIKMQGTKVRALNHVGTSDYLKGVVPSEMPSSWPAEALKVQAVAARSYALSGDSRFAGFADTCDTVQCQVYGGFGAYVASTNAAIDATKGVVRIKDGAVARTEFSASTGGYTAGGTFPAVVDEGDATPDNPWHNWQRTIDATKVEQAYPSIGDLQSIQVTKRNGLGADGGRVTEAKVIGTSTTLTVSGDDLRSKLGLPSDWFTPSTGPAFSRIAAADRYATAAAIASSTFPSANVALLARGDGANSFPDGLAANYLGGVVGAPTLLATSTSVPQVTVDKLKALKVTTVRLLGGTGALSDGVASSLTSAGFTVDRVSGADRYATAAAVAGQADAGGIGTIEGKRTAILSSGEAFPDALAAGGLVYRNHYPQLLTAAGTLPEATKSALGSLGIKHVIITGGTTAVSDAVKGAVEALGITTERLAGATRYETAVAVAEASINRLTFSPSQIDIATGATFPDALTAGSHAGRTPAPIVLAEPGSVPQVTCSFLGRWKASITGGAVFGGTGAVSDATLSALRGCLS